MSTDKIKDHGGPVFPMPDMKRVHEVAMAASCGIPEEERRELAYIIERGNAVSGMMLRDYFAAQALALAAADEQRSPTSMGPSYKGTAIRAYMYADEMLKARQS